MEGPRPAAIPGAGGRNTLHPLICAAIVAAAAVLAYLNSFQGAFHLDDYKVLLSDPAVRSWGGWWSDLGPGIRPLLKLSYALNWSTGLGLFGFHLVNLLIHLGVSILVLLLARKLTGPSSRMGGVALFAALLFALHPIQTEAVTYLAGRSASLVAFFYLASLAAYIHGRLEGRPLVLYALSPALFLLALAVKETAATLPAALLLWEITRRDRPFRLREAWHPRRRTWGFSLRPWRPFPQFRDTGFSSSTALGSGAFTKTSCPRSTASSCCMRTTCSPGISTSTPTCRR